MFINEGRQIDIDELHSLGMESLIDKICVIKFSANLQPLTALKNCETEGAIGAVFYSNPVDVATAADEVCGKSQLKLNSSLDSWLRSVIQSIDKFKIIFYLPNKHHT